MGICIPCSQRSHQHLKFFDSNCSELDIEPSDLEPISIGGVLKVGKQEEKMKSVGEQEISKADGTLLQENVPITPNSATYREKNQSLISTDDPTSSNRNICTLESVSQKVQNNSVGEKEESVSEPSASGESAGFVPDVATESEENKYVIPQDNSQSPDTQTPNSVTQKVKNTSITLKEEPASEAPLVINVDNSATIQKRKTMYLNEDKDGSQTSGHGRIKNNATGINKRCVGVEDQVEEKTNGVAEYSIPPPSGCSMWNGSRLSLALETFSGITIPIQVSGSIKTYTDDRNRLLHGPGGQTSISIWPNDQYKAEQASLHEKDKIIQELLLQNERLRDSRSDRGTRSSLPPLRLSRTSTSNSNHIQLRQKHKNIAESLSSPPSPVSDTNHYCEQLADNEDAVSAKPFKFLPIEISKERRSRSEESSRGRESITSDWECTAFVML